MSLEIRLAAPGDAEVIANLNAASWRSTYRGVFSDAFLDGEVQPERRRHWRECLQTAPSPDQGVLVAMDEGACVGFIRVRLEAEPVWGPLLDSVHVHPERKGTGIGQRLIRAGQAWTQARGSFDCWHLWVVEANAPARGIYQHLGWERSERAIQTAPDGTQYPAWRYRQWLANRPLWS